MLPIASPPALAPDHAQVVDVRTSYDARGIEGEPIANAMLRDARGVMHTVRVVGGANRRGGVTRVAGLVVPTVGAIVRLDLAEDPIASAGPTVAWTRGDPPATWLASSLPVAFALATPVSRDLGATDTLAELDVALRTWPLVACTGWRTTLAATTTPATAGDDGVNAIYWHDDAWPTELVVGALAQTILHVDAMGNLHDADIHVNGAAYQWSLDGAGNTVDARSILVHELGHALGLGHTTVAGATMNATHPPGISWRSLERDDRDGVCALYAGSGADGCETGAACPTGFACVARACERSHARAEVCSPCVRVVGACEGAGDDARCIDVGDAAAAGRVCGRACSVDTECGPRFHCLATTTSGDLQCVSNDACASGPWPCTTDADCDGALCRGGACVCAPDPVDAGLDATADASSGDAGPITTTGGCAVAHTSAPRAPLAFFVVLVAIVFARSRRAWNTPGPWTSACSSKKRTSTSRASPPCSTSSDIRRGSGRRAHGDDRFSRASTKQPRATRRSRSTTSSRAAPASSSR